MDPIESIKPYKDTSFALMLAAQALGHEIVYLPKNGLALMEGVATGMMQTVTVTDGINTGFASLSEQTRAPLSDLDVIMIRVDPPFDSEYLYGTHILERANQHGVRVVNNPQAIRDCNEKLFATEFSALMPTTWVSSRHEDIRAFQAQHPDSIRRR